MSKNEYLHELAKGLLFKYSFSQLIDILKDYSGFWEMNNNFEDPKTVCYNLKGEVKNYITNLFLFTLLIFNLFILILVQNKMVYTYTVLLISSITCPILTYFFIGGKKLNILYYLNSTNTHSKKIYLIHLLYILIAGIILFLCLYSQNNFFNGKTLNSILNIFLFFNLCSSVYILFRTVTYWSYYFCLVPHSYGIVFMILAIKIALNQLTSKPIFILFIIVSLIYYFIGVIISLKISYIIKKEFRGF